MKYFLVPVSPIRHRLQMDGQEVEAVEKALDKLTYEKDADLQV